mmetsp:Transcript_11022/g.18422  ORF Transcript_11022/g.18422 Transcript_11022/m.18422 type:complete len:162 (+) Transcript_11022:271-756(+)
MREAIKDCTHIIHTASPLPANANQKLSLEEAQTRIMRCMFKEALENKVEKIVVTSDALTMCGSSWKMTREERAPTYNEFDYAWRSQENREELRGYIASKCIQEAECQKFLDSQLDVGTGEYRPEAPEVITLHPGLILGPPLSKATQSSTIKLFRDTLTGKI